MRKKIYSVFVVLFALCSSGLASPALELFDQASATLQREYFGYSSIDLPGAIGKRRGELETACRPKGEACAFEMAAPVLAALTADLGDDHTYYVNPGSYRQQLRAIAGQGSSKTRFGLRTAHLPGSNARVVLNVREDGPAKPEDFRRGDRIYAVDGQVFPGDPGQNDALWNRLEAGGQTVVLSAMRDAAKGRAACRSTLILESARQVQGAANLETRLISSKFFTCNFRPSLSASNL